MRWVMMISQFMVGGALSKNIKSFTDEFVDVEIFKLEQNYRSTNKILKVANSLISHNKNRLGKDLWTNTDRGDSVKSLRI